MVLASPVFPLHAQLLIQYALYIISLKTLDLPSGEDALTVNAIGTQLLDPINSRLTRWSMAVLNK